MSVTCRETWLIGTSGPIDAGGNGPQRAKQASRMSFGREGVICEYIEIMQIPPRFERRRAAYKSIAGVLQYGGQPNDPLRTGNTKIQAAATCRTARSPVQAR